MATMHCVSRQAAIKAALEEAERHLLRDETVCLKVYQALGVVTVLERKGRKDVALVRFTWKKGA